MDTVSYLTINDETKQIADIVSRNDIENISTTLATHGTDIENIQFEVGSTGPIMIGISQAYATAMSAQASAALAAEAAAMADEKAVAASQSATSAQSSADEAAAAALQAWNKVGEVANATALADEKADLAGAAANAAQSSASNAATAAANALSKAEEATTAADTANYNANLASSAANIAQNSAEQASNYAQDTFNKLAILESVVDTVNWFADHRILTTDLEVDNTKIYYIYNSITGTISKVDPVGDENPNQEGWYELDETIQNYIVSRVVETDDGLTIFSPNGGWRILISNGTGNYLPGLFIIDPSNTIKQATTYRGISFDQNSPFYIGDEDASITFDGNGQIIIGGTGVQIAAPVTIGGRNKTLSQVLDDLNASIKTIEYGLGNSSSTHSDIIEWVESIPNWEKNKYIWMRTTTNGLTYTYACIQGAQGPKGDTGPIGKTGSIGIGIKTIQIQYGLSEFEDIMPIEDDWKDSINDLNISISNENNSTNITGEDYASPSNNVNWTPLPQGSWLWVRTITTYTNGSSETTYQKSYIGTDGEDGTSVFIQSVSKNNGKTTVILNDGSGNSETLEIYDGEDGTNGITGSPGINGKSSYTHFAWATEVNIDNTTNPPTTNVIGFDRENSINKPYIGVYSDEYIEDSNNPTDYSWTLIKGAKGDTGAAAYSYELFCNPSAIVKTSTTDTPTSITFTSKRAQGIENLANYSGRFIIATSVDGSTWINQYTSSSDESSASKTYTAPADAKFVRCQLYLAGGTSVLVDTQTVPIISNGVDGQQGEDGKILNIHSNIYTISTLPNIENVDEADAYLVDDGNNQYDLYYKGTEATNWTIVENWQGAMGPAGEDGYTIILTNESHVFPAGVNAAIQSSTSCQILAYKGSTQVAATIGTITGQVTGLTTSIANNNSTSANFTVNATTTLTTKNGTLTIPIVVDNRSFTKKFTWSLANEGAKGDTGEQGPKGNTGATGNTGPEAVVTIIPSNVDWNTGTATLTAILRVNGQIVTPTSYAWTQGISTSLGNSSSININNLNTTYNCTVTW